MIELAEIPQQARERVEQIGAADLVVAILAPAAQLESVAARVRESVGSLHPRPRTVVVHSAGETTAQASADTPSSDVSGNDGVRMLPFPLFRSEAAPDRAEMIGNAYHAVFAISKNLGARATVAIVSDLETVTPQWIHRLTRPVLELDFDLATPCYAHARFKGLLNSSVLSPLTRALYGKRIQHPLGPDFGFSQRLVERLLANSSNGQTAHVASLASITVDAVCDGFEICEAPVGVRRYPPADWMNQSSVLAQILGPLFTEAELRAPFWQRIRGSQPVPLLGEELTGGEMSGAEVPGVETASDDMSELREGVDVRRMIESFQLGCRDLREIWGIVLPPGTLLELTKLSRLAPDHFHVPDVLWARIIYDFALGHRLRIINQEHLLRAMTPLYLAWVASYALELGAAAPDLIAQRLEQLSLAFEATKPYVLSRWRWPDRFNP
jgi:hypothetical protein